MEDFCLKKYAMYDGVYREAGGDTRGSILLYREALFECQIANEGKRKVNIENVSP